VANISFAPDVPIRREKIENISVFAIASISVGLSVISDRLLLRPAERGRVDSCGGQDDPINSGRLKKEVARLDSPSIVDPFAAEVNEAAGN